MNICGLCLVAGGYILGSVFPSYIFYRKKRGGDIREAGDGNPGAANVAASFGSAPGFIIAFLDYCKGIIPVFAARMLGVGDFYLILTGIATVAGHDYSIFLKFKGGKGTMTSLGVLSFFLPFETVLAFSAWLLLHFGLKTRFIGAVITFLLVPFFTWLISCRLVGEPLYYILLPLGILALFLTRMTENIGSFFKKS